MIRALTAAEASIVTNALRVAADQYDQDAKACADTPRVAEQFQRQAKEARDLCDLIEEWS